MATGDERTRDPLRLLAQRSELGYVDRVDLAMRDEPEAVSVEAQRNLTSASHLARRRRREQAVTVARRTVDVALDELLDAVGRGDRRAVDAARTVTRSMQRLGERIVAAG